MPHPLVIAFERADPPKGLEVRPRQVKAWIDSLPMQQTFEAVRSLHAHLSSLNRAKLDRDARVQILEAYRAPAGTLLDELDAIYEKAALPLGTRPLEALALARDFAAELALGYQVAIVERGGKLFGARKELAALALRAMEYLSARLRASYKSYTPPPAGAWSAMHRLYLHAEEAGAAREPVDRDSGATVSNVYCEALLLSLTDPYRLAAGEVDRVLGQLRGYRGLATLGQSRPATAPGAHFLVPCDTDKPPKPALSANDDTGGPNWRLLDAGAVVERLRMKKDALEAGNVSAALSKAMGPEGAALLARLIVLWGDPPRRASRREPVRDSVAICAGLKAVSHFVSLEPKLDLAAEDEMLRRGITMPLHALPLDDEGRALPVFEWDVVNRSDGGLKVRREGPTPQPIAVGEVLGVKLPGRPGWTVGAVRWITIFEEGGMEFGLQHVATRARRVWVQPTSAANPQAKVGLLLGEGPAGGALLTPPNTFSELREFELDHEGSVCRVRARGLIEKTGRFELFEIAPS